MEYGIINAEKVGSPHIGKEHHGNHKPAAPRKVAAVAWIRERLGYYWTEKELAAAIGMQAGKLSTVLSDLEDPDVPFRLCEYKEGSKLYFMALPNTSS